MISPPSGYTSYASIGQYFISGYLRPSGYAPPPQAGLQVTDITQPGAGAKQFTVTYTDNLAIDVSTIDGNDVRVTGPNGYDRVAQFVSVDDTSDGTPRVATYAAEPPANSVWTHSDNGLYTISLRTNQVSDTEGGWTAGQQLGQFSVSLPLIVYSDNLDVNSGWTLQPQWEYGTPAYSGSGPSSGFTGTKIIAYNLSGNYANDLATVYATSPVIDCSGAGALTLRFQRWLRVRNGDTAVIQVSTNDATWTTVWSASQAVQDSSWQQIQHALPASVAGSSSIRLRWGMGSNPSQRDIGWNIDDIEIVGQPGGPAPQFVLTATANNPAWGTVNPSGGDYPSGSTVDITAMPATYFRFKNWSGDASGTGNPVTVSFHPVGYSYWHTSEGFSSLSHGVNTNLSVQAVFDEILTTNHPTPYWWLASYGYTQNQENAVMNVGSNGLAVWQSYIAGLNPKDATSQLRLSVATGNGNNVILQWNAVTGRVYTVWSSTNGVNGFAPIASPSSVAADLGRASTEVPLRRVDAANLPSTITGITNGPINNSAMMIYRLEVRKP